MGKVIALASPETDGSCGWLIQNGDDWQSSDDYGPEHTECRGAPPVLPPFEPRVWSHNSWGEPE